MWTRVPGGRVPYIPDEIRRDVCSVCMSAVHDHAPLRIAMAGHTVPLCKSSGRIWWTQGTGTLWGLLQQKKKAQVNLSSWPCHSSGGFFILVCEAIGTAATPGLLCQPRVIVNMIVEKQMECRLAGETEEVLGENLPQRHFCPSQNLT
jgi:hypothetical protein